jgi:endonuclease/exonuclease/phosphatase (EEP) superfamily protein YafD
MKYKFYLGSLSWGYLVLLFGWLLAYLATGDHFGYLGLLHMLAVYFFIPLPVVLLAAAICRQRSLWIGFGTGLIVFLWLWGALFWPVRWRVGEHHTSDGSSLTVMTYNVLARHDLIQPLIATIRAENADVVFLQELNAGLAQALQNELSTAYPYQVLRPVDNPSGIGVISKYPIQPDAVQLPSQWVGDPILLRLAWKGQTVRLVNFHMFPTTRLTSPEVVSRHFRIREAQATLLVDYARQAGPVILAGDANAAPLNQTYKILTADFQDAWQETGFGLGHTFPGSDIPGSSRPRIGEWSVPQWLVRIDYVFYSNHWEALSARLALIDGVSDHRGVVAVLRLR